MDMSLRLNETIFNLICINIVPQIYDRITSIVIANNSRVRALNSISENFNQFVSLRALTLLDIDSKSDLEHILLKYQKQLSVLFIHTNKIEDETVISDICAMVLCEKSTNLRNCSLNFRNNCVFKNVTMSNIECLTIGWCSMSELFSLLIHTRKLRKLNIRYLCNYDYRTLNETHLMINNLNVFLYFVPFNNIELLLNYIPKLKKLTIKGQLDDFSYTDTL
ncbi:unnamed protein product [Didymodactylos carnosus]|uniref:Uncharacterized protein n=1 Tax=Didymodactylos carnosus TaxID=1234261 RepID=A0A8S2FEV1_9BILA|nr:unnamed protein product [Didymodactylos carnosus]CAF4238758.1 unnamed protein product [Didymodactylos carnosus]